MIQDAIQQALEASRVPPGTTVTDEAECFYVKPFQEHLTRTLRYEWLKVINGLWDELVDGGRQFDVVLVTKINRVMKKAQARWG